MYRPQWRWWYGLAALVIVHVIYLGAYYAMLLGAGIHRLGLSRNAVLSVPVFGLDVLFLAVTFLFARRTAAPRPGQFGLRMPEGGRVLRVSVLAWLATRVATAIGASFQTRHHHTITRAHGTLWIVLAISAAVIVAPFVEEVFFRGFLFGSLRNRLSLWPAALICGVLFGAVHVLGNGYTLAVAFPVAVSGVAWCLVLEYTGSLWTTILLHSALNLSVVSLLYAPALSLLLPLYMVVLWRLGRAGHRRSGRGLSRLAPKGY